MKHILNFIISILLTGNTLAQLKKVNIDIHGDFEVVVQVGDGYLIVNDLGEIIDIDIDGPITYYMSGSRKGKVEEKGNISFDYYIAGTRKGKLKSVGSIDFDYWTYSHKVGKLKSIDHTDFDYHFSGIKKRKLLSIDSGIYIDYYNYGAGKGKASYIGSTNPNRWYVRDGITYYIGGIKKGKFKSGNRSVIYNGIQLRLRGGY
ncbi:hypothetical protein [Tenacibaculum sp. C7A-26P2]|uniref:hypothetical protein n=1 Tax=Tenacibaculum sp. C7A-26P2 TaxID=3447504 RepID=UPI003F833EF3